MGDNSYPTKNYKSMREYEIIKNFIRPHKHILASVMIYHVNKLTLI